MRKQQKKEESLENIYRRPTQEEIFLSNALLLLITSEHSYATKKRTYEILKNLPHDAIKESRLREVKNILIEACEKFLHDENRLLEDIFSKAVEKQVADKIAFLMTVVSSPISHLTITLANEILANWKKEKKENLKYLLSTFQNLTYEDFEKIAKEIYEIENYSPFPDDQEAYEEEQLLSLASKSEDFSLEFAYLYDDFIPAGTINLWVAPPAQGKSALALAVALSLLDTGRVEKVIYLDGDNPITVLKNRQIDRIIQQYQNKLYYFMIHSSAEFKKIVSKLSAVKGRVLIVVDTLRAFVGPEDINKGEIAENVMTYFRSLTRDGSKTVILLHHVNKPPATQQEPELMFRVKGATEFLDRADIAFFFNKKRQTADEIGIELRNIKPRIPVKSQLAFRIFLPAFRLLEVETILAEEEEQFICDVLAFLDEYPKIHAKPANQHVLVNHLVEKGYGRNETRRLLDKFNSKFWIKTYDTLYNQICYKPKTENWKNWQSGKLANLDESRLSELWGDNNKTNGEISERQTGKHGKVANLETTGPCQFATSKKQVKNPESLDNSNFASLPPFLDPEDDLIALDKG